VAPLAQRGKPLDERTRLYILRARRALSIRQTAREAQVSRNTARKYLRGAGLDAQGKPGVG
jgi:transcriptional regulator with XRE-family HTH domain